MKVTGNETMYPVALQVIGEEEKQVAHHVIDSEVWVEGKYAQEFRDALGRFLGVRYVELTNSGSSANLVALLALQTHYIEESRRLQPGDEVITTALCFPTTVSPIKYAGCTAVFVDVERGTWNIDTEKLREAITDKTKVVMIAHSLGNPFNIEEVKKICDEYGLWLIEDNCDCLAGEVNGRKTGSIGDIGTSSFYPAHHISTGEGGAVYTNNPQIRLAIRSLINWGRDCWCPPNCDNTCGKRFSQQHGELPMGYDHKNTYSELGFNFKMTEIQASIGAVQMTRLREFVEARRRNHQAIEQVFRKYGRYFEFTTVYPDTVPSWFGYVIKVRQNEKFTANMLQKFLDGNGIQTRAFFCGNITRQPALLNGSLDYRIVGDLKVTDEMMFDSFWIGCHPGITEKHIEYLEKSLDKFMGDIND